MFKKSKIIFISLFVFGFLFLIAIWYRLTYSMDEAEAFEINTPKYQQKLLIATQGSEFKNSVTKLITNQFKDDSIFIKVVDISALKNIKSANYDALLILHTWENWEPPADVKLFVNNTETDKSKIVIITTSGEGSYKMENIDAITGESKPENITSMAQKAIQRLKILLD